MIIEKINELVSVYKDDTYVLDIISNTISEMSEYVDIVVKIENSINIRNLKSKDSTNINSRKELIIKKDKLENAIRDGMKLINTYASAKDLECVFQGNLDDFKIASGLAIQIVNEIFESRNR